MIKNYFQSTDLQRKNKDTLGFVSDITPIKNKKQSTSSAFNP